MVQQPFFIQLKDPWQRAAYKARMAMPQYDWYLAEWMATLGKRQADIVADLEWNPARISLMLRGKQQYNRDAVNELSLYLSIRPFELLMPPEEAMALRKLRAAALSIAAESEQHSEIAKIEGTARSAG